MTWGNVIDKTNSELNVFSDELKDDKSLGDLSSEVNRWAEDKFSDRSKGKKISESNKNLAEDNFNIALDRKINELKYKEMLNVSDDTLNNLKMLEFQISLEDLQNNIIDNNTDQSDNSIETSNRKQLQANEIEATYLYNSDQGLDKTKVINEINKIEDNAIFDKMSAFLKSGTKPDIKKFQLEMLNVLKPQEEEWGSRLEDTWNDVNNALKWDPLGNGWVDGKFWPDTMKALKEYVVEVNKNYVDWNNSSTEIVGQSWNETNSTWGSTVDNQSWWAEWSKINNNASSIDHKEVVNNSIDYGLKEKYEVKQWEKIVLAKNVIENQRKIYPENENIKFDKNKEELIYTSDDTGEETFTLTLEDDKWKRQKKTMTVEVEEKVEDNKTENERKTAYDKYKNLHLKLWSNYKKNKESLNVAMKSLKQDYQDLDREIDYLEVINNQWDSLKSNFNYESVVVALKNGITDPIVKEQLEKNTEEATISRLIAKVDNINESEDNNIEKKLLKPKKKEQKEIEELTDVLLNKEASESLIYLMSNSIDDFWSKLNDEYVYYFDGKYLSQDKFIKKLKKWKISNVNQVGLNVDFKWTNTKDYLKSDVWNLNRNWEIKSLTLTDDLSVAQNGLTHNVDVQYKALWYGDMEIQDRSLSDRRALKRILWITGLFGMWWTDEDLSIADKNYDVWYEKEWLFSRERKQLKKLKRVLLRLSDDDNLKNAFKKAMFVKSEADINKMKSNNLDKDIIKLSELYLLSKNIDQPMPQLEKSLWLLENYFVRGIDSTTSFEDIYDKENIGTMDWLIDPDKKRKAVRAMFKWEYFGWLEDFPEFENSQELRELKRMVKKIDLADFFQGNNRSKWKYKKFNELYSIYSSNKIDNLKDENDNVVVGSWVETNENWIVECTQSELYYNAVFDFLVWVWEWNQSIVESLNSMHISQNLWDISVGNEEYFYGDREINEKWEWIIKESTDNYKSYNSKSEKQFMLQVADLNSDGRADFADGWLRMWMEIKNIYKDVKLDQMSGVESNDKPAWQNIVEFAKDFFQKTGKTALLHDLDALWWKNEEEITLEKLNAEIAKNPGLLNAFQEMLVNSPIPLEYIYRYGSDAAERYLSNPDTDLMHKLLSGKIEVEGVKLLLDKEIKKLVAEWLEVEKIPELKSVLKPMLYGALIRNGGIMTWAAGVWLALNMKNAGNFSLNLGYTDMPSGTGWPVDWTLWVMMSWGDSWKVWADSKMIGGVWTGVIWFVPVASGAVGISTLMNKSKITKDSLKPSSATYFNANGHLAIVWWLPVIWAGVWMSFDKIEWINRKYDVIKNQLWGRNGIINQVLENVTRGGSKTDALVEIKNQIAKKFYQGKFDSIKSNEEKIMVSHAAENIYRWLSYYNIDAQTSPLTQDVKNTIVHDMAENYAVQWKNNAVKSSIDDVHVDGFWVWVSFLAWFMPIPYAHVSIAEYKNLYYTETKKSVSDYYAQLSTGVGMEHVDDAKFYDWNGVTSHAIAYLNAKMNIAHAGIDNPDLDIKLSYDIEDDVPVFEQEDDELPQALYIPKDLCNYANINISSDMEQYVNIEKAQNEEWEMVDYVVVPVSSKISLLSRSGGSDGRFNLIIWDTKAELDDVLIWNETSKSDLTWNPANFEWWMNEQYVNIDKVNDAIVEMSEVNLWDEVITNPLISCENDVNWDLVFNLNQNIVANCVDMWWANSELSIDKLNNKMMMPQTGTLTMRYVKAGNGDEKYEMYYSSNPNDKLDIKFDAEWDLDETQSIGAVTWESVPGSWPFGGDVFEVISKDVDGLFSNNIVKELRNLDAWTDWYKFLERFLEYSSRDLDSDTDNTIDKDEYNKASQVLIKRFWNNFKDIKDFLEDPNKSIEEKSLVINRIKWIMAFDGNVSKWSELIKLKIWERRAAYQKLQGPSGELIWNKLEKYRNSVFDKLEKKSDLTRKVEPNLFGYTAFYRKDTHKWRNFSMTAPGDTKVLWWEMEEIKDNASKKWFRKNFKLNKITQNVVAQSIISQLKWLTGSEKKSVENYIKSHLIDLMDWEEKELDIGLEKYKIQLDVWYYFYLLGECANESIWVKLNGIKVLKTKKEVWWSSVDISVDASSTGWLYVDSVEALNQAGASKRSALIGAAFVDQTPNNLWNPTDWTWDIEDPGDGTWEVPNPNDWTGDGDDDGTWE